MFGTVRFTTGSREPRNDVYIECHDLRDCFQDSRSNTPDGAPNGWTFGLRKLDNYTKNYKNVKITLEPQTEEDAKAFSLITGLRSMNFRIGKECDKLDIKLFTNLHPEGRSVPAPEKRFEHGRRERYKWQFDLAKGEYPTKIEIDLGTLYTNPFPASRTTSTGLRNGEVFGDKYNGINYDDVSFFDVYFKDSSTFFTGSAEEAPIPTDSEYHLKASVSTDTDAKFINGSGGEGVEAYSTVGTAVRFKSRFETWLGYKDQAAELANFKENGTRVNYVAYQGSNVTFRLDLQSQYGASNYSGSHFFTEAAMKNRSEPLSKVFGLLNYYTFPGKVYFEMPRGIQLNKVSALLLKGWATAPTELSLSEVKELANGNDLYVFEGEMYSIPGAFLMDITISPNAKLGEQVFVENWGLSMDGFAKQHMTEGYQDRYPYYTYHFTEKFPEAWGVDATHVLKAKTTQKVNVLEASIDGILLRPGKSGAESSLSTDTPFSNYYQPFEEAQKNDLFGFASLFNGTTSTLDEYRAEIELPRTGGKVSGTLRNGTVREAVNEFPLYLCEAITVKAPSGVQELKVTYLDDNRNEVSPTAPVEYANVRYIQVHFKHFEPKKLVRLILPLMTDYDKPVGPPVYTYLTAKGAYRQNNGPWGDLKTVDPVGYRFDSPRSLILKKVVAGDAADLNREFKFSIEVKKDGEEQKVLHYRGIGGVSDGIYVCQYGNYISLKNGQGVEFYDIQPGAEYSIREEDYSGDGYHTHYQLQAGDASKKADSNYISSTAIDYGTHEAIFTNHKGARTTWTPTGMKLVNGGLEGLKFFGFALEECDGTGKKIDGLSANAYNNSLTGVIEFNPITFTSTGDYWYKMYERPGNDVWFAYDMTVYLIKVHVSMDGGTMKAEPKYFVLAEDGTQKPAEEIIFNNKKAQAVKIHYEWVGDTKPDDVEPPRDEEIPKGTSYTAQLQEPSEQNMVFVGWFTDRECKKPYANGSVLNDDLDLYGYWKAVTVEADEIPVSYVWNLWDCPDGTPTDVAPPHYDVIKKGSYYTPKAQDPTAQDFTFHGWYDWDYWDDFTGAELYKNTILLGDWKKNPTAENGNLTVTKTVAGNAGNTEDSFNFVVSLSDSSIGGTYGEMTFVNGSAKFVLKGGESKNATGLPAGITYEVTEVEANQNGYTTTSADASGSIVKNATVTAAFTNTRNGGTGGDPGDSSKYGNLTVSKAVAGTAADVDQKFTFTVKLDQSLSGKYGDMQFDKGVAVVKLKHGESSTAVKLPEGVRYTVTESGNDGYTVTASGESGTIHDGKTAVAAFINTKNAEESGKPEPGKPEPGKPEPGKPEPGKPEPGKPEPGKPEPGKPEPGKPEPSKPEPDKPDVEEPLIPSKPADPGASGDPTQIVTPSQPNVNKPGTLDHTPKTDDAAHLALWIALMAFSLLGMVSTVAVVRKNCYRGKRIK